MDHKLLALSLFKTQSNPVSVGERATLDYQQIAIDIILKFIDVLEGVVILVVGIFAIKLLKRYFARIETTHERQKTAINLLEKITSGFLLVVSITLALKVIGLDLTLLVSVLTLGLSFGMRDVIKNYVAGLLILFKSPFEIGDIVKIRNFTGRIEKIEFQSVTMRTFEHREVTIHNSDLLTRPIMNYSKSQETRVEISLSLGYGSDLKLAMGIFDQILQILAAVLKVPKYSIVLRSLEKSGVEAMLRFWVQKPCNILKIRSELVLQIQEAFDEEKILAPYTRESQLSGEFGMSSIRQARLKDFYGQPMLANIAGLTAQQVATVAVPAGTEEYVDAEEPE